MTAKRGGAPGAGADEMSLEAFRTNAEAYGGRISRWPEDVRAAAERVAAEHAEAVDILREAAALDALLDAEAAQTPEPPPALLARILVDAAHVSHEAANEVVAPAAAEPAARARRGGLGAWFEAVFGGAGLAAAAAAGLAFGLAGAPDAPASDVFDHGLLELADGSADWTFDESDLYGAEDEGADG